MTSAAPVILEGDFRVVASADAAPVRKSPNRQRLAARILFWNSALMIGLVALPLIL